MSLELSEPKHGCLLNIDTLVHGKHIPSIVYIYGTLLHWWFILEMFESTSYTDMLLLRPSIDEDCSSVNLSTI